MSTIGIVHGGSASHLVTLDDPEVARHAVEACYLPELTAASLAGLDTVIVADRLHPRLLRERAGLLLDVLARGGTLVVLGENEVADWLPGVSWESRPTNFWWWVTGEDHGMRPRAPEHPIWLHLGSRAVRWHHHGVLTPAPGATVLVALEEDGADAGAILYDDPVSTPGRLIVTTLDPTYHHGSNFMPGATQFLYGLLDWLTAEATEQGHGR